MPMAALIYLNKTLLVDEDDQDINCPSEWGTTEVFIDLVLPEPLLSWSTSSTRTVFQVNASCLRDFCGLYREKVNGL